MSESPSVSLWVRAVRHGWPIMLVSAAVAVIIALVLLAGAEDSYEATATIEVDTAIAARFNDVPTPERMLTELKTSEFREFAAAQTGLDASKIAQSADFYTKGSPQFTMFVTYREADEAGAKAGADGLAHAVILYYRELASSRIEKQRELVSLTEDAIELWEEYEPEATQFATKEDKELEKADRLYNLRVNLVNHEALLDSIENAYLYSGDVAVSRDSAAMRRVSGAVGAGVVGLALGFAVALARERFGVSSGTKPMADA
ncbi:MAG: hypothetical protein Kow0056_15910 [Coriobacteriia bacterium]